MENKKYESLPASAFELVPEEGRMHDKKLESKPIGYFRDAFNRFCKNKSSVVAAIIIMILFMFAVFVPIFCENKYTRALTDTDYQLYTHLPPKSDLLAWAGMDGTKVEKDVNDKKYGEYVALYQETGLNPVVEVIGEPRSDKGQMANYEKKIEKLKEEVEKTKNAALKKKKQANLEAALMDKPAEFRDLRLDTYMLMGNDKNGMGYDDMSIVEFKRIQNWQMEHPDIQVIFPAVNEQTTNSGIWYQHEENSTEPIMDMDGNVKENYLRGKALAESNTGKATVKVFDCSVDLDVTFDAKGAITRSTIVVNGTATALSRQFATAEFTKQITGKTGPFVLGDISNGVTTNDEGATIVGLNGLYVNGEPADPYAILVGEKLVEALNEQAAGAQPPFVHTATVKAGEDELTLDWTYDAEGVVTAFTVTVPEGALEVLNEYASEEFTSQFIGKKGAFRMTDPAEEYVGNDTLITPIPGAQPVEAEPVAEESAEVVEETVIEALNIDSASRTISNTIVVDGCELVLNLVCDSEGIVTAASVTLPEGAPETLAQYATEEYASQYIGQVGTFALEVVEVEASAEAEAETDTAEAVVDSAAVAAQAGLDIVNTLNKALPKSKNSKATKAVYSSYVTVQATYDKNGYLTDYTLSVDGVKTESVNGYDTDEFAGKLVGQRTPFVLTMTDAEREAAHEMDTAIDGVTGATMTGRAIMTALNYAAPEYTSTRVEGDDGSFAYCKVGGSETSRNYSVRISLYNYFRYKFGFEPEFFFGTNTKGQDILTRLASGARFSFILAIGVSSINMLIGAIYGAIQGYFGGAVDLVMDRISDVLNNVPFMVVTALFQLHLAKRVGPVVALIFAFVLTGWIGMAARVRMQFYRFKGQEYILAARTLGASDFRLMFKHIFPNSLGTIITGSVLVIPGMIFSESSMTYLGIVNLESSTMTSVGTMLANGRDQLQINPHIILFPALYVSMLMISFNLFGNGLRDAFNPSLRGTE